MFRRRGPAVAKHTTASRPKERGSGKHTRKREMAAAATMMGEADRLASTAQYQSAVHAYQKLLDLCESLWGEYSLEWLAVISNLASCYSRMRETDKAIGIFMSVRCQLIRWVVVYIVAMHTVHVHRPLFALYDARFCAWFLGSLALLPH